MIEISIIVPVYKAEKYLTRCVNSILAQTFPDFELILVDDGSPDRSGAICDSFAEKDSRIQVIHQPNSGASAARNIGIKIARGRFILFCDSDDYVHKKWCEEMIYCVHSGDYDMAICSLELVSSKNNQISEIQFELKGTSYLSLYKSGLMHSPCNKIFKKEIIENAHLNFEEQIFYHEDLLFVLDYFLASSGKFSFVNKNLYLYCKDSENSLTKRHIPDLWNIKKMVYERMDQLFETGWTSALDEEMIWDVMDSIDSIIASSNISGVIQKAKKIKKIISDPWFIRIWNKKTANRVLPTKTKIVMYFKCPLFIFVFLSLSKRKNCLKYESAALI